MKTQPVTIACVGVPRWPLTTDANRLFYARRRPAALTDPSRLARWYGEIEADLRPGGEHRGRLLASGWEGSGREERGMPLPYLSAYAAGVQLHVEDLADYLAARERRKDFQARWDELHPAYQALEKSRS
jgi:hypothetical protein